MANDRFKAHAQCEQQKVLTTLGNGPVQIYTTFARLNLLLTRLALLGTESGHCGCRMSRLTKSKLIHQHIRIKTEHVRFSIVNAVVVAEAAAAVVVGRGIVDGGCVVVFLVLFFVFVLVFVIVLVSTSFSSPPLTPPCG